MSLSRFSFLRSLVLARSSAAANRAASPQASATRTGVRVMLALALASLFCPLATLPAQSRAEAAAVASRLTQPIDERVLVAVPHTRHPLASSANDRGLAPDSLTLDRVQIVLRRSNAQETALRQLISDLHNPTSASFHKWLTPDQFGQRFGPSDADAAKLQSWLESHGFGSVKLNPGRQTLEFSGSAAQFREAFHTNIHRYVVPGENARAGQTHFAANADPQIPAALAPVVGGFTALNNFHPHSNAHLLGRAALNTHAHKATPEWTTDTGGQGLVVAPADYAVQYDLNPLYSAGTNGTGQTIAVIDASNIDVSLVNSFRTLFGLPANPPNVVIDGNDPGIDAVNNPDGPFTGSSLESYLDVEWAGAVAPNATIDLVIAADTALETGFVLAAEHAVYANLAPVVSLSFGECEADLGASNTFWNALWSQAAAQGITVAVSAGDSGSAGCDSTNPDYSVMGQAVNGFASTPYNVAVGGTDFFYSDYAQDSTTLNTQLATYWNLTPNVSSPTVSLLQTIPEQPFNDSQYGLNTFAYSGGETNTFAAGGGASNAGYPTTSGGSTTYGAYPKPTWQTGTGVPADSARDLPDLALFGALGYNGSYLPICAEDGDCQPVASGGTVQFTGIGGTSAAAPAFAGMMALVNQKYGLQGQANFVLYPLAVQYPAVFHDITQGTNSVPCNATPVVYNGTLYNSIDCIAVSNPVTDDDATYGTATEGQIGDLNAQTPWYNAATGYDLASGLGSIDAAQMVNHWQSVTFGASTVTLTPSSTSFTHGTAITVSGTVTGSSTPTGSVALMTDSTEPLEKGQSAFALSSGAYSASVNYLPGGTYDIYGTYSGDTGNAAATSTKTSITVTPENSGVAFNIYNTATSTTSANAVSAGATVPYGTQLLFSGQPVPLSYYTACVAAANPPNTCSGMTYGIPTGSVAFLDGSSTLATATLNAEGDAEANLALSVGSHSISASYSGDHSYNASTASAIALTVTKDTPSITLSSTALLSANTYQGGQAITFAIQVENQANAANETAYNAFFYSPAAAPTGTVTVTGLPAAVPTTSTLQASLDPLTQFAEGLGSITAPATVAAGTYTVTVSYPGDANYAATSQSFTVIIVAGNTALLASTTTATQSSTSTSGSSGVTVAITVTGQTGNPAPTGAVLISTSGNTIGYATLTAGSSDISTASVLLSSSYLNTGVNIVTLQYSGDTVYQPSSYTLDITSTTTSSSPSFTLSASPATIALSAPGASGSSVVTITPSGGLTGTVALACAVTTSPSSATSLPTCAISSANVTATTAVTTGLAVNSTSTTTPGTYTLTITGTNGSVTTTTAVTLTVSAAPVTPTFNLNATAPAAIAPGATATSAITVTPTGGFTGTVTLACAVSPTVFTDTPTCSITQPSAITDSSTSPIATLTISTTAATTTSANRIPAHGRDLSALLATLFLLGLPTFGLRSRRSLRSLFSLFAIAILGAFALGCGSGQTTAPQTTTTTTGGTTAANYTITVTGTGTSTGTSTAVTQSTIVTVTVN